MYLLCVLRRLGGAGELAYHSSTSRSRATRQELGEEFREEKFSRERNLWRKRGTVEAKSQDVIEPSSTAKRKATARPTPTQRAWLRSGLDQAGGKLPLFDERGQRVNERTIKSCVEQGWAAAWFDNPIKPDWLVCKLTDEGRKQVE
jgi:hypothetical protein